jgi:hypothetical protein
MLWMGCFSGRPTQDGFYGTKTFFIKVQYDCGDVSETTMAVKDFAWMDRGEMTDGFNKSEGTTESNIVHAIKVQNRSV